MNARAGENDTPTKLKEDRINTKLNRRKEAIQKKLFETRTTSTLQKEQTFPKAMIAQEEPEDKTSEESRPYGHKDLSKHHKTKPRRNRRRCWICKSPNHYKRQCPSNRCFYCHMLGHVKADCNKRKINFIFNRLMEMFEGYKEANKCWHKKTESIKKRMEESRYKKEGGAYKMYWNETQVGEYTGPGAPKQFKEFLNDSINWKFIDATLRRATPIEKLKKYEGFTNWCACGDITLNKNEYIKHVKQIHNGIALPKSILNRPPWVDYVFFYSDEAEEYYAAVDTGPT